MDPKIKAPMLVFSGNSHPELARMICERLGIELAKCQVYTKSNRETTAEIKESVRGKDVFIIQTGSKSVNNDVMELHILAYACKTSCARSIIGVLPYLPYCKQSKMRKRGSIVCRLLADMLCKAGMTHIITMDLHQKEIQGFFSFPIDNLRASPFFTHYITESIPDFRNSVLVARNPSALKRASSYAERLRLGIAVIHGETKDLDGMDNDEGDDGRTSPPLCVTPPLCSNSSSQNSMSTCSGVSVPGSRGPRRTSERVHTMELSDMHVPTQTAKEKPPMNVVGDVGGKIAIMVDDMIDDVASFIAAADILKERGAYKVYVMATHGLLSADAPQRLEHSSIDEVVVTNTVPHDVQKMQCGKIKTVDVSVVFAEAIRRIHNNESMSYLFRNISRAD